MTPTEHDLDRAWEPLARFVRNNALIHACMDLHASGRLSELTAKLTAVDALRFRLRELGGRDCDNEDLLFAIRTAALHSPQVGEYGPLHALIASLAKQMDTLVRRQVSEMERSQLSAFKIKLTAEDAVRLGIPVAKKPPCET